MWYSLHVIAYLAGGSMWVWMVCGIAAPKQAPRLDPKDEALMSEEYAQPAGLKRVLRTLPPPTCYPGALCHRELWTTEPHEVSIEHSWTFSSEYMDNDLSRNFYSVR